MTHNPYSVRTAGVSLAALALMGTFAVPAIATPHATGDVVIQAESCDSAWWTWTSATRVTFVPTKNGTGDARCVLGQGSQGWGVVALQNVLRKCYNQQIALDGVFGSATKQAVKNAQTWENAVSGAGLVVDGVYGDNTRKAIKWPLYTRTGDLDASHYCAYVRWGA
ncbi:hypothetical protein BN159_5054 [Streptomyces davaonensis JCM 4913]|uniref:Peptidoglycan binding-like domain-containing protein n=1 Tax=Streptomyces davaonensis (strain DSM 101723 / JCM 4913 / KCC S-0913 / 768) TaxID=1214101 RepID=K4R7W0_STRDJ|nr:peptidoglycan-binding domain-containing protein [Streptomyces davaonensis]CCK29433.1 hypothetical protein BN159_5054 [Streptomyces davaonensis JCM 4913]